MAFAALSVAVSAEAMPMFTSAQRAEGLREGKGMGLATSAENNGYPGPRHVLDQADRLNLSADQRAKVAAMIAAMKAEAIPVANVLLAHEVDLEDLFKSHTASVKKIDAASHLIGESEAKLRTIHLKYHLQTVDILTAAQVAKYYEPGSPAPGAAKTETQDISGDSSAPQQREMPGTHEHKH
jgi:Spy/CpxP family protein refolding chaperone